MDILYSNKVQGFCIVSSDSDFTRLATRLREAGMKVYGIGEKKTPEPFIVACDKFIYLEILKEEEEEVITSTSKTKTKTKTTKKKRKQIARVTPKVVKMLDNTIEDLGDEEGWAFLGDVGSLIQKKAPNFDSRNYGFNKLTPLIKSIGKYEIEVRENYKGRFKLIYVRIKESWCLSNRVMVVSFYIVLLKYDLLNPSLPAAGRDGFNKSY